MVYTVELGSLLEFAGSITSVAFLFYFFNNLGFFIKTWPVTIENTRIFKYKVNSAELLAVSQLVLWIILCI